MKWKFVKKLKDKNSIEKVEKSLGIVFPEEFRSLVLAYNNGTAIPASFDTANLQGKSFGELLDFNLDPEYNVLSEYELIKDKLPPYVFPFAGDAGGNYLCFDYRVENDNPKIVFWDHEQIFEIEGEDLIVSDHTKEYEYYKIEFVANNLKELFEKLYDTVDEDDDEDAEILYNGID